VTSHLIVLGSANRDYTVMVERHPLPGETVLGGTMSSGTGGKGANQAAAAALAGVTPIFVGAVGADSTGDDILSDLGAAGVDVSFTLKTRDAPTGVALITVTPDGENSIVVAPGANSTIDAAWAARLVGELMTRASVVLAQLEIPLAVVEDVADEVEKRGGRFVLNLSPTAVVSARLLGIADPLIVNETEASELSNSIIDSPKDAEIVAARLAQSSRSVVLTLGGNGVVVADSNGVHRVPAVRVPVVDTTGAGDAFAGALAAALASGHDLVGAVGAGIVAGAEAVQYVGAQPPRRQR
jgi:ribokinase